MRRFCKIRREYVACNAYDTASAHCRDRDGERVVTAVNVCFSPHEAQILLYLLHIPACLFHGNYIVVFACKFCKRLRKHIYARARGYVVAYNREAR